MNLRETLMTTGIAMAVVACANAGPPLPDSSLGLSKTSVFDTPNPKTVDYDKAAPGQGQAQARYFPGAPATIPHNIDAFMPIKPDANACLGCHDKPDLMERKVAGPTSPMPANHYSDPWAKDKPAGKVSGAHYTCTLCHVPQTDAKPLVHNTLPNTFE